MKIKSDKTKLLKQAHEESGPAKGEPLLLLYGRLDSPRSWDTVLPSLHAAGYRPIVPYLRGYGSSVFRDPLFGARDSLRPSHY